MNQVTEVFTSRSAILTRQSCPRKWWFEYGIPNVEANSAPGIVPNRLNIDLLTGSGYHIGMENLLRGSSIDESVGRALEGDGFGWPGMWPLLRSKGLVLGDKEDAYYVYHEQASLVEALIRGYARYALPLLLDRFTVVEVERDGEEYIEIPEVPEFRVRFGYRADALLMEKDTLDLYVLSHKTTKEWNKKKEDSGHRDMQGMSEIAAVDTRLQRWASMIESNSYDEVPLWFQHRHASGAPPLVFGVKMEYALKGARREYPKGSGKYFYSSPLIRPWKKEQLSSSDNPAYRRRGKPSASADLPPYAVAWEFTDELGGNHTLGKGWRPINIWEDMGVKNWIDYLSEERVQGYEPGSTIERSFVLPMEFFRNDDSIQEWKEKTVYGEQRNLIGRNEVLDSKSPGDYRRLLNKHYDTHTERCDYPVKCPYQEICFGADAYLFNPLSSGSYEPRTPNHSNELIQIEGEE